MSSSTLSLEKSTLGRSLSVWLPLGVFPVLAMIFGSTWPAWQAMWLLALSVYAGLKWLSFADYTNERSVSFAESCAYLLCWPGMNAAGFFEADQAKPIRWQTAGIVFLKICFSAVLLVEVAPRFASSSPFWAAWVTLTGLYFLLHSGLFHGLALLWQSQGRWTEPLMHWPVLASSVSNYWGVRWNTAFRDLAQSFIFRPMLRQRIRPAWATMVVFTISGLVHDLVISLPAKGGWGLPTVYFLIQGLAILLERSKLGQHCGLGRGMRGRLYAWLMILLPAPLLFHGPFLSRVILPMTQGIGELF